MLHQTVLILGTSYKECPICCGPLPSQSVDGERWETLPVGIQTNRRRTDDGRTEWRHFPRRKEGRRKCSAPFACAAHISLPETDSSAGKIRHVSSWQGYLCPASCRSLQQQPPNCQNFGLVCRNRRCRLGIGDCA